MSSPYKRQQSAGFLNINLPLTKGIGSAMSCTSDVVRAAKNNLVALLLTRVGERIFSNFGTNLQSFIFEPGDSNIQSEIEQEVRNSIQKWLPYLQVSEVKALSTSSPDRSFRLFVRYILTENQYEDSLEVIV